MNYACRLLRDTSLTVEDVMFRVGYHNATHFYNSFKKQTGMSPKEWRDSGR
jgi:AraC family L-rhamnose operon regulatory protein RhaS